MKILYLCNEFPVLSETFLIYEIADLLERGADIRILALAKPKEGQYSDLPKKLGFENRIFYRSPLQIDKGPRNFRKVKLLLDQLFVGNISAIKTLFTDKKTSSEYSKYMLLETANSINNMSDGWKPDIIHCHFGTVGRFASILKQYDLLKAKISTIFHGYDVSRYPLEKGQGCYDILFKKGDLFLSVNEYYLEKIIQLGAEKSKGCIFHMGVDLDDFQFSPRSLKSGDTCHFISIGRMTEKKGHEFTIRAFAELLKNQLRNKPHLHLIGDGPLKADLEKLVHEDLNIADHVTFYGVLQHADVKEHLKKAHIFILPSVTANDGDMEGIPVVLMEAMAQGLPVISTYHSGIPDLITHGETGYLAEEKDVSGLANIMSDVLNKPDTWIDITNAARVKVEEEFNRKKQADKLSNYFKELLRS